MRIEYLQEYVVVASSTSLSQAAQRLHVSVSALSKHMTSIEKELGVKLLNRSTTKISLTVAGRQFLEDTLTIGEQYDRALERLGALSNPAGGTLRIVLGVRTPVLLRASAQARADVGKQGLEIDYSTPAFHNFYETLSQPEVDAVVTYATGSVPDGAGVIALADDPWVAVVKNGHLLADRKQISLVDDLKDHTVIRLRATFFKAGFETIEDGFARYGVKPKSSYSIVSSFDDLNLNSDFSGVLILPRSSLPMLTCISDVTHTVLTFKEDLWFKLSLVFQKDRRTDKLDVYANALKKRLENQAFASERIG